ncbi:unnamed protein product [Leptidea sinapis]|uniref:Protein krueppel n=1 Tax=Leptidea sinapis TaxID=189913 RepID=A0A5E4R4T8_9NEOP|nr:unnamed protein product [Leptidea sinapis]
MDFEDVIVKESPGVCRCCLSEGCYKDLGSEYLWMEETEVYADMLLECFDISISQHSDGPNGMSRLICEVCVTRLRDACNFKKQVLQCKKCSETTSKTRKNASISATQRNRLIKKNALNILESSTVLPFKWYRHSYLCFFCHKPFRDITELKDHTEKDHKKSSVKSAVMYLKRDEKIKIDVSDISCKHCLDKLNDLDELVAHSKVKHNAVYFEDYDTGVIPYKLDGNKFQCAICSDSFQYFITLNQHMNSHYGNFVCELCGKSFLSQERLRCHSLCHGSKFRCNFCSDTFESLSQRSKHEATIHSSDKSIKCFYCAEKFQNYALRKRHHIAIHHIEAPVIKCTVCAKTFNIDSKMRVHMKEVHLREKNYSCTICEQKFFSRTHVQKHMIKHSGDRIHECGVCKKAYARKQTLRDHMRIHSNERRFVCPVCSQGFVQNNSLRLHLRVHHSENI